MRIYPLYWLCCAAMLLVIAAGFLTSMKLAGTDIAASLALIPSLDKIIGVSWTLVYEIYFYLVFALSLRSKSLLRSVTRVTAAVIGLLLVGRAAGAAAPVASFLAEPIALEFCLGMAIAYGWLRRGERWLPAGAPAAIGFALLAAAPLVIEHASTAGLPGFPRVLAWGLPAGLIVAAVLTIGAPRTVLGRFATLLGDASYALYLTHAFVMIGYGRLVKIAAVSQNDQIFIVPLVVILAIAIGLVTHLAIERPLLNALRGYLRGRDGASRSARKTLISPSPRPLPRPGSPPG